MKVSSKLIMLISLGITMIGFQFGVNRYLNKKMNDYNRAIYELNKMSENLLNAIIEEKEFTMAHDEESLNDALKYVEQAKTDTEYLGKHLSVVSSSDVKSLSELLSEYRQSFMQQAQYVRQLDAVETDIDDTTVRFTTRSRGILEQITNEIGIALTNAEEVDEHLRTLADVVRDTALTVNQLFLIINDDLFRKNNISSYLLETRKAFDDLEREHKNAIAISKLISSEGYTRFLGEMIDTIRELPPEVRKIRQIWTSKDVNQGELDGYRLQVIKAKERMLSEADKAMAKVGVQVFWVNGLAFAVSVLALFFIGMGIVRSTTKPISGITASTREIAEGNLSLAATEFAGFDADNQDLAKRKAKKNEIWQLSFSFALMAKSLRALIGQVQKAGIQVVSSATEISASAGQLKETAAQQVVSINQVGATSRDISSRSQELSNTMNDVAELVAETATLAQQGHGGLAGLEAGMQQFMDATSSIAKKLERINERTHGIDTIVTTITKVAAQTNLLSLNAAIEAEKAGEYGFGFSVVAREIRRLADQTAVATLDIEQMVQDMQSAVTSGVTEVNKFVQQVHRGVQDVDRISEQLSTIIDRVQALTPHFDAVNEAMRSQSEGAEEISKAMVQLSETAELTTHVIHDFKVATEQLTEAAQGLQGEVSKFRIEA